MADDQRGRFLPVGCLQCLAACRGSPVADHRLGCRAYADGTLPRAAARRNGPCGSGQGSGHGGSTHLSGPAASPKRAPVEQVIDRLIGPPAAIRSCLRSPCRPDRHQSKTVSVFRRHAASRRVLGLGFRLAPWRNRPAGRSDSVPAGSTAAPCGSTPADRTRCSAVMPGGWLSGLPLPLSPLSKRWCRYVALAGVAQAGPGGG